jgi:hypothetical protein
MDIYLVDILDNIPHDRVMHKLMLVDEKADYKPADFV